jgi:peroxiredoxin
MIKRRICNMKIVKILVILAVGIAIISGCSGPATTSTVCPDMGTITSINSPQLPLKIDTLVGSNMPDFSWDNVDFESLEIMSGSCTLSQFGAQPVMIIFHKTMNCPGCKAQMPFIKAAYETWKDRGLVVLTIYRSDQPDDVKGYVQSNDLEFIALADPDDRVASELGFAIGAPMSVFIDKSGIIKQYQIGPLKSQQDLEAILQTLE